MRDKYTQIGFSILLSYTWLLIILFGGIVSETIIFYPNIFHDVPASLKTAKAFAAVSGPGTYFPILGGASICMGILALLFSWGAKAVRYRILLSLLLMFFGEFLFSMLYFWPKNKIMFGEGADLYAASYLQSIARKFQKGQWLRVIISGLAAVICFAGFLRFCREVRR